MIHREVLSSSTAAIDPAVARIAQVLKQYGFVDGGGEEVELALREALANAILHGNRRDRRKRVEIECFRAQDDSVTLVVRDQGKGFDPAILDDPTRPENVLRHSGRGIFLIRYFADEVRFTRGGREIHIHKKPDAPAH